MLMPTNKQDAAGELIDEAMKARANTKQLKMIKRV